MSRRVLSLIIFFSVFVIHESSGQCFYSFKDTMNSWQYWVFENGKFKLAETQESRGWKRGWDYVVYVDKFENFMFYKDGVANKVQKFPPQSYHTTDQLLLWTNAGDIVYVFSDGETKQLGKWAGALAWGDSVVAFSDNFGYFQVFYKGQIYPVGNIVIQDIKASDNLLAYFTGNQLFNVFYRGENLTLEDGNPPISFEVNRNIVAYVDFLGIFKVFWNGNIYDVASFQPQRYITGEDFVVFISPLNEFKVFYKGEVRELLPYVPPHYQVIENMLVYTDRAKFFNVFYKGKNETLEYFIPRSYKVDNDMLVWTDLDGYLNAYDRGVKTRIGNRVAKYYDVHNRTVFYWQNPSEVHVYCDGKNYSYQLGF